jgi:hypothetical protein
LKIPPGEYTLQSFLQYITDHTRELFAPEERKWLKVYLIFVQVDWTKLFSEFKPQKLGQFLRIPMSTESSTIDFYAYEYAPGLLMFFTSSTEEDYERSLEKFINSTRGITEMWIPPARFEEAKTHVLSKYNGEIYKFIGRRTAITKIPAKRRPEYQRRISYSGLDGQETLKEVRETYGVLPISIEFVVGQDKFKITNDGLFVLRTINLKALQIMLDVVDIILGKQLHFEKVTQGVSANVELVQIGERRFRIPEIVAAKITLKTQTLNAILVERIFGQREDIVEDDVLPAQRPWSDEFSFVDKTVVEGSLSFSGTVVDEHKGTVFGLSGGENEILLIPKHHTTFESFVRFYRMIVEKIDDEAELSLLSEEIV